MSHQTAIRREGPLGEGDTHPWGWRAECACGWHGYGMKFKHDAEAEAFLHRRATATEVVPVAAPEEGR